MVERQAMRLVKVLRSDRGGEFLGAEFTKFLKKNGIRHQLTCPGTPQQNGIAERANWTIGEAAKTLLGAARMPYKFWPEAVRHVVTVKNRVLTHVGDKHWVPYERWLGKKPSIDMLWVWGCMGLVMVPKEQRHKLEVAAVWAVHLGMPPDSKGWLMWDPKSKRTLVSRDVKFVEDVMYKDWQQQQQVQIGLRLQEIERSAVEEVQLHLENLPGSELTSDHSGGGEQQVSGLAAEEGLEDESARVDSPSQPEPAATAKFTKRSVQRGASPHGQQIATREKRVAAAPSRLKYSRLGGPKQGAMAVQADEGEDEEMAFCFFTPLPGEPATVEEALSGPQKEEWKAAMDAEFNSLIENGTWELVELPEGRWPISSKWVFKVRSGADGALERFKSRLVAKGFQQKKKVDFGEIFAPVVKLVTLRTVLAGAAVKGWHVKQMDITTAFLSGILLEDIYMAQPDGYGPAGGPPAAFAACEPPALGPPPAPAARASPVATCAPPPLHPAHCLLATRLLPALRYPPPTRPAYRPDMDSLRVLAFDHEGRPIQFDTWLDNLQLYLLSDSRDSVSLFDHTSGAAPAPPATGDSATRSQWLSRDAAARLAIRNHLPLAECAHFIQHRTTQALYGAVVARYSSPATAALGRLLLTYLIPELSAFATVEDLVSHLRTSDARYRATLPTNFLDRNPPLIVVTVGSARGTPRTPFFEGCSPSPLAPSYASAAAVDVPSAEDVAAASRSGRSSGGRTGAQCGGFRGGQRQQQQCRSETPSPQQLREWIAQRGASGGSSSCPYVLRTGDRAEFGDEAERPRWAELLRSGVAIFDLDFDAILAPMYALSVSAEGDSYLCVPLDLGIEAAALGASESILPGTAPDEALHTFTLDSGASRCFYHDSTTLTPLSAPVPVRLADPSGGLVHAHSSTVLPCPTYRCPPGRDGHYHHSWGSACVDLHVYTDRASPSQVHSSAGVESVHTRYRASSGSCVCSGVRVTSGSRPLLVSPSIALDPSVAPPPGSPLPATPSWHALPPPCLWSSHVFASPPALACPALPSLRRGAAARCSSLLISPEDFSPAGSPHGRVGPSPRQWTGPRALLLLVVDDYTRYTTVFPLHSKGQVIDVLIPWIRAVRLQLCERFRADLPVLHLHSNRGGEFSSDLLWEFCRGEGILQSFTLPDSPQ
ncbi:unnamed protein product [Closterium sp. NIES-53]